MEILKTATGKEFKTDYIATIPFPQQMYVRIIGESLETVASVFSNPEETIQMWYNEDYYAGYTKLLAIIPELGAIKVALAKEA